MAQECLLHSFTDSYESNTSERPITLSPTLMRWWEWPEGSTVVEWKGRQNATWNACSKYVEGVR